MVRGDSLADALSHIYRTVPTVRFTLWANRLWFQFLVVLRLEKIQFLFLKVHSDTSNINDFFYRYIPWREMNLVKVQLIQWRDWIFLKTSKLRWKWLCICLCMVHLCPTPTPMLMASSGGVVVILLACGATSPGFKSGFCRYDFWDCVSPATPSRDMTEIMSKRPKSR